MSSFIFPNTTSTLATTECSATPKNGSARLAALGRATSLQLTRIAILAAGSGGDLSGEGTETAQIDATSRAVRRQPLHMTKYEDFRRGEPLVTERFSDLAEPHAFLREQQDTHFRLVQRLLGTTQDKGSTPLFPVDIVLMSVINRSLDLIDGFLATYNRWNLSTAAPQVRMQVDNLLRVTLLHVAPVGSVTEMLLSGKRLSEFVDPLAPAGKKFKLTDRRLREHAAPVFEWLDLVYRSASGWVHFSGVHIGVTMQVHDDGRIEGHFPSGIDRYPYDFLDQVLWAMNQATQGVIEVIETFAAGKEGAATGWE